MTSSTMNNLDGDNNDDQTRRPTRRPGGMTAASSRPLFDRRNAPQQRQRNECDNDETLIMSEYTPASSSLGSSRSQRRGASSPEPGEDIIERDVIDIALNILEHDASGQAKNDEKTATRQKRTIRIIHSSTKQEPRNGEEIPPPSSWLYLQGGVERSSVPGAESIGGRHVPSATSDNGTIEANDEEGDESAVPPANNVVALAAQLVDDPIEASEVRADRSEELELKLSKEKTRRRRLWIVFGMGFILVVFVVAVLVYSLLRRSRGSDASTIISAPSASPTLSPTTTAPTLNPTTSQQEAWIRLIQSRMSSITFENYTSPQRRALEWLVQDPYTKTLDVDRIVQRFTLAVLYYATEGPTNWSLADGDNGEEWLLPSSECEWGEPDDVGCSSIGGDVVVTSLALSKDDGLVGTIPREIGLLSELSFLDIGYNDIHGTIPSEIGLLSSRLTTMVLYGNNLEGTIPSEIGQVVPLFLLALELNDKLSGTIPSEFANLVNLEQLTLEYTNLSGSIPSSLCSTLKLASVECDKIECECCKQFVGDYSKKLDGNHTPC